MEKTWEELPKFFTPALKKLVVKNWHAFFSNWGINKIGFDYLLGPLVVGIGFQISSDKERYLPCFSVHNLLEPFDFLTAILNVDLPSRKTGSQNWLVLRWHNKNYQQAVQDMKAHLLLPERPPISLENVIKAYQKHVQKPKWASVILTELEDPIMLATWGGDSLRAKVCLEWAIDFLKAHPDDMPKEGLESWCQKMETIMSDPEKLRVTAREEVIKHKLTKIPSCCFSDTPYQESLTTIPFA